MKDAYYVLQNTTFNVVIPKKRGEGHLKSCFGWHSHNEASDLFDTIKPKGVGDTCDIDGYLSISTSIYRWEEGYKEMVNGIIKALSECFPYVDNFIESQKFWEIVDFNISKPSIKRKNFYNKGNKSIKP